MIKIKIRNPNHPKKGAKIRVDPIRKLDDIKSIKKLLSSSHRDLLLFTIGINNGLRVGDLLKLKVKDVRYKKIGDALMITESKSKKPNVLVINKSVSKALTNYLNEMKPHDDDFLFSSKKTRKPLTIQAVNALVKKWAKAINLNDGNYGAHTLRKTFGYIQRTEYGVGFEILAKRYNHSNPAVTMRYLGIEDKEVHQILMNEI